MSQMTQKYQQQPIVAEAKETSRRRNNAPFREVRHDQDHDPNDQDMGVQLPLQGNQVIMGRKRKKIQQVNMEGNAMENNALSLPTQPTYDDRDPNSELKMLEKVDDDDEQGLMRMKPKNTTWYIKAIERKMRQKLTNVGASSLFLCKLSNGKLHITLEGSNFYLTPQRVLKLKQLAQSLGVPPTLDEMQPQHHKFSLSVYQSIVAKQFKQRWPNLKFTVTGNDTKRQKTNPPPGFPQSNWKPPSTMNKTEAVEAYNWFLNHPHENDSLSNHFARLQKANKQ